MDSRARQWGLFLMKSREKGGISSFINMLKDRCNSMSVSHSIAKSNWNQCRELYKSKGKPSFGCKQTHKNYLWGLGHSINKADLIFLYSEAHKKQRIKVNKTNKTYWHTWHMVYCLSICLIVPTKVYTVTNLPYFAGKNIWLRQFYDQSFPVQLRMDLFSSKSNSRYGTFEGKQKGVLFIH